MVLEIPFRYDSVFSERKHPGPFYEEYSVYPVSQENNTHQQGRRFLEICLSKLFVAIKIYNLPL